MSNPFSEDALIEQPAIRLFKDVLEWQTVNAYDETFGANGTLGREHRGEVVLVSRLRPALEKLNPALPSVAIELAIAELIRERATLLPVAANQDVYKLIKDGVKVKFKDDSEAYGRQREETVRVMEWENPKENDFLLVSQLWVTGNIYTRRTDLLGFVNGLPLVFIELKASHKQLAHAYRDNLRDYKETIPQLFWYNALIILSNGSATRLGSLSAEWEHFNEWKRINSEGERGVISLDTVLRGVCEKSRLLDIVENFILYTETKDGLQKLAPMNHQYLGVNNAYEKVQTLKVSETFRVSAQQIGVFWHTQGSGKSYSMIYFAQKVQRKLAGNWTFLIVTDRIDLDDQIYKNFAGTGAVTEPEEKTRAQDREHLRQMLADEDHRYVFTTIQKFGTQRGEPHPVLSQRSDIIVITDEAHRSQYDTLALNMRNALPNAAFLGFTGTPLIAGEEERTREVFGDYVSIYDFQRAVADGATLPLFYENAGEKLKIIDPKVSERIAEYIETAKQAATLDDPWSDEKEEKLYRELARDYPILTSPTRLDKVAQDFVDHFHQRWRVVENGGGKAMMVCLDKITCVKMHDLIVAKWQEKAAQLEAAVAAEEALFAAKGKAPTGLLKQRREQVEWMQASECCVVVSQEQGEVAEFAKWKNFRDEPLNITPHREKMVKRDLEKEFKKADHPFRIAIVCAMWLTGFDVKCLATLYLDKPMQGHTLMQAIARVNRVGGGKKHGLIIDYNGMIKSLRRALATFAQGDRAGTGKGEGEQDTVRDDGEALAEYANSLKVARDFLTDLGFDLDALIDAKGFDKQQQILVAVNLLCESDERRKTYQVIVEDAQARHRGLFPHPGLFEFDAEESALTAICNKMQDARVTPDVSALLQDLYDVVDIAVATEVHAVKEPSARYNLSNIDFARLRAEFEKTPYKNVVAMNLMEKIEERLARMVALNPTRVDLYERYQEIVQEYNKDKDAGEIQKVMDDLFAFNDGCGEEEKRYLREGLESEEQLAVFDLLQKDSLTKVDRDAIKVVAKALLDKLTSGKLQIDHWREKATAQAQVKAEIIKHLFSNMPSGAYDADEINLKASAVFAHIYTAGFSSGAVYH